MYFNNVTQYVLKYADGDTYTSPKPRLICSPKLTACIHQFNEIYANEEDCISLIHKLRWPDGFQCPRCDHKAAYTIATRRLPLFECCSCGHQASLTAGTVMHKSRTSLRKWLLTMYIVAACEESINAVHLAALLSVTYKTAWAMLNKIRQVISEADRKTLLSGAIEAKYQIYMEQFLPLDDSPQQEKPTIIARTFPSNQPSYYKIKHLKRTCPTRDYLTPMDFERFAREHASSGLKYAEVKRRYMASRKSQAILPQVARRAFRWLNDTFHGLGVHSFQAYLDEFCFRLNYPISGDRCPFERLLQLGLKAISIDEPTNYYQSETPCKVVAA